MEKINVAELLKDCPQGMELDCTMYDNITFCGINERSTAPINIKRKDGIIYQLTKYGQPSEYEEAKCVIFPKGKTTWEGFQRPFKDGDVITSVFQDVIQGTGIFNYEEQSEAWIHACINLYDEFFTEGYLGHVYDLRFATEEEKQKLFQAIKEHGYKWNPETKTLEKLIGPKFKVGDIVLYEGPLTKGIMIIGSFDYGDGTKPEAARAKIGDSIYIKTGNSTIYSSFVPSINNIRHATDDEVIDFVNKEGCQEYLNFYKDWLLNHCSRLVSLGLLNK